MSSPGLATVVIACPHCGTRYQVPYGTLGADGRDVQCAQCTKSWHATGVPPAEPEPSEAMFSPAEEAVLDAAFEAEQARQTPLAIAALERDPEHERTLAEIRAAIAPRQKPPVDHPVDPAQLKKTRRAFERRLELVRSRLPLARLRRIFRIAALATLVLLVGVLVLFRTELVRQFPALADLYQTVGLEVNVVGLRFEDVQTLMSLRDGKNVMQVSARIRAVAPGITKVPPVLVTLLDADGKPIYEWSVSAEAREMAQGDVVDLKTEVNSPPAGAVRARLSFTQGSDSRSGASS